jgi:succinate dehydrogenase flavin-adding protein (antitoxin of CptAB toxin-antitoxin module)
MTDQPEMSIEELASDETAKSLKLVSLFRQAGYTGIEEILDVFINLMIMHFYDTLASSLSDEQAQELLNRLDDSDAGIYNHLKSNTANLGEAMLSLMLVGRSVLDAAQEAEASTTS